jgi:hypothetical protein
LEKTRPFVGSSTMSRTPLWWRPNLGLYRVFLRSALNYWLAYLSSILCVNLCGLGSRRFDTHSSGSSLGQDIRNNLSLLCVIRVTINLT